MTVYVQDEAELEKRFVEAIHIMRNMRHAQINWHDHFGSYWKDKRKTWETRADDLLEQLKVRRVTEFDEDNVRRIELKIKNEE